MRISKYPYTILKTNPSGLKLSRNFIGAVRCDIVHFELLRSFGLR